MTFCCSYAQEHEELAMALVNEFWSPEKDDYRSMVQQCLKERGDGYMFHRKTKLVIINS